MRKIILIGASTGGPGHLEEIFRSIPDGFNVPIVVAQHINGQFLPTLSESLNMASSIGVKQAKEELVVTTGGYLVGGDVNRVVIKDNLLSFAPALVKEENSPSVNELFSSGLDLLSNGYQILAVLLTGIGQDGAKGLLKLKLNGAKTLAESEKSSVVFGMPRAAHEMGAVESCTDLSVIIDEIIKFGESSGI